ncbi:uncharacterized protein MONOS_9092 [Monocercomonoides exilis]|uniref:uncharacterized protein n=1 Tax=Monocercomonoides exilis TaxID=2049356 RepID=UPI00355ACCF8|nr:hypothetical protein MONOS_9092 [Monocercomonoides exilis]|eukprot:MONOS_9092.1-p1 / transcript=MONOS_9092.1 / gene=MONOS_9092 / organism=Monocercomonoides_exilis_PA203 / gene_product=unspecified product / transcript_product=unspecified product / location=Mono_scaffold00364:10156-10488(+) / protein_length=111 / sequence_SO=supercontig / SO=protein_coding / is_pseudo=false
MLLRGSNKNNPVKAEVAKNEEGSVNAKTRGATGGLTSAASSASTTSSSSFSFSSSSFSSTATASSSNPILEQIPQSSSPSPPCKHHAPSDVNLSTVQLTSSSSANHSLHN